MNKARPRARSFRRPFQAAALVTLATLAAVAAPVGCSADMTVVGGACATGYTQCGVVCVDTTDDPENCGGCGVVCPAVPGLCVHGACVSDLDARAPDASANEGGTDAGARRDGAESGARRDAPSGDSPFYEGGRQDGGAAEGSAKDVTSRDAPDADGPSSDAAGDDASVPDGSGGDGIAPDGSFADAPPRDGASTEGSSPDGATADAPAADGPAADAVTGDAVDELCAPPASDCGGVCVDETSDPSNCGACGKVCPSGLCYMGVCEGSTDGDIVLIGHDFSSALSTLSEGKILSNAVFLPSTNPVKILSFEHYADATAVSNVKSILGLQAALLGRTLSYTVSTTDTDVPAGLTVSAYDVLLVYDQESAAPGVLGPLGKSWASTLSAFTIAGGVVVSLDGAAGATKEMPAFDTQSGLFAVTGHTVVGKGTALSVIAPGDVIGHGVVSPYACQPNTVSFGTSVPSGGFVTYVVVDPIDGGEAPVVIHVAVP